MQIVLQVEVDLFVFDDHWALVKAATVLVEIEVDRFAFDQHRTVGGGRW